MLLYPFKEIVAHTSRGVAHTSGGFDIPVKVTAKFRFHT